MITSTNVSYPEQKKFKVFEKISHRISQTEDTLEALNKYKHSLCLATLLAYPDVQARLSLITDASDFAVGAVLQQYKSNMLQLLPFFLKKLRASQRMLSFYRIY